MHTTNITYVYICNYQKCAKVKKKKFTCIFNSKTEIQNTHVQNVHVIQILNTVYL
jgi:hypothetical protein